MPIRRIKTVPDRCRGGMNPTSLKDINVLLRRSEGFKLEPYGISEETDELILKFVSVGKRKIVPFPQYIRVYSIGDMSPEEALATLRHCLRNARSKKKEEKTFEQKW